jgi:hypothetical protein
VISGESPYLARQLTVASCFRVHKIKQER